MREGRHESNAPRKSKGRLKIATLNMRGAGYTDRSGIGDKWLRINQLIREQRIGVLAVQESHLTQEGATALNDLFHSTLLVYASPDLDSPTAARGVAFVVNRKIIDTTKGITYRQVMPGRAASLTIPWGANNSLKLLNVYAPNDMTENADFWTLLASDTCESGGRRPDVLLGDFNMVESADDRAPARADPEAARNNLATLKRRLRLTDGWRERNQGSRLFSFVQTSTGSRSRIDRIYVNNELLAKSADWRTECAGIRTDHSLVSATLANYADPYIGPGRWVIPAAVVSDRAFLDDVVREGRKALEDMELAAAGRGTDTIQSIYGAFKSDVAARARERTKCLFASWDKKITDLKTKIAAVTSEGIDRENNAANNRETLVQLEEKLSKLLEKRFEEKRDELKTKQWVEGDRVGRFWMGQGREYTRREPLYELRPAGGGTNEIAVRSTDMAELAKRHYDELQGDDIDEISSDYDIKIDASLEHVSACLNTRQKGALGAKLTTAEVRESLLGAAVRKAAGLDGLTTELWQALERRRAKDAKEQRPSFDVAVMMTKFFNDVEANGLEENSRLADGWICPIYKLKGDTRDINNYRPITVLNADYKVFTKALSVKLATVAASLIHEDQSGFIAGRKIHDNVKLTRMLMAFAEAEGIEGAIVALDQEKAYDKVNHKYLWEVLRKMNFPVRFINTVRTLYGRARSIVMLNGTTSKFFSITRGVRQGDPLSCLLFNLAIEPLACSLRASNLAGFEVPGLDERIVTTMFADDTTVYLKSTDKYEYMSRILEKWCAGSRAKFNEPKTVVVPVGPRPGRDRLRRDRALSPGDEQIPDGVKILEEGEGTRILGAWIGPEYDDATPWARVLETISANLDRWCRRRPTLRGKQAVLNVEVGGRTQYLARVQGMPREVERSLDKLVALFLWEGKKPTVARSAMEGRTQEGGLRLLNVNARNEAIDLMWLKEYLDLSPTRPKWAFVADTLIARAILASERRVDRSARANMFLQTWHVNTTSSAGMPRDLARMIKAAQKYGVRLDAPSPANELRKALPLWYHFALVQTRSTANKKSNRCLRKNHGVATVADCLTIQRRPTGADVHHERRNCKCRQCEHDRTEYDCEDPPRCARAAATILRKLRDKWKPEEERVSDGLSLSKEQLEQNRVTAQDGGVLTFNPSTTQGMPIGNAFRIFIREDEREMPIARRSAGTFQVREEAQEVYTDGSCERNGTEDSVAGAGVWFGDNDPRNVSARVPGECPSNQAGEAYACLVAVERTPDFAPLTIVTDSMYMYKGLTTHLEGWEDRGWAGMANVEILQKLVATLRKRSAKTQLKWVKGHSGVPGNEEADRLAAAGLALTAPPIPTLNERDRTFLVPGAKLATTTQKMAYQRVLEWQNKPPRAQASLSIAMIQDALEGEYGIRPKISTVWTNVWGKDIAIKVSCFFWRLMHNAYKVGKYWTNIPGYEQRSICRYCDVEESAAHILLECAAPGQSAVWSLARTLLGRGGVALPALAFGVVIGIPSLAAPEGASGLPAARTRLMRIVLSESAYFIWRMRCERVIGWESEENRVHSTKELRTRWSATINERLRMDIDRTRRSWRKRQLPASLVLNTWKGTLDDEAALPEDWTRTTGVLVGRLQDNDCYRLG